MKVKILYEIDGKEYTRSIDMKEDSADMIRRRVDIGKEYDSSTLMFVLSEMRKLDYDASVIFREMINDIYDVEEVARSKYVLNGRMGNFEDIEGIEAKLVIKDIEYGDL